MNAGGLAAIGQQLAVVGQRVKLRQQQADDGRGAVGSAGRGHGTPARHNDRM